jgi:hypothetical protein
VLYVKHDGEKCDSVLMHPKIALLQRAFGPLGQTAIARTARILVNIVH